MLSCAAIRASWLLYTLIAAFLRPSSCLPSQKSAHLGSASNHIDEMSLVSHDDGQQLQDDYYEITQPSYEASDEHDHLLNISENWTALPFNIFYPDFRKTCHHSMIDFSRDTLLDPMQHGPQGYATRQDEIENSLLSGRYGANDYSYQLDKENEAALNVSMRFVSLYDSNHGAVFIPHLKMMYYHRDMTEEEAKRRWKSKNFMTLHYDSRSNFYWVTNPKGSLDRQ